MFQFSGLSPASRSGYMSSTCRVAPFGHLWINARLQLPIAFRSLPRPSSSLRAKASTIRPYLLPILNISLQRNKLISRSPLFPSHPLVFLLSFLFLPPCQRTSCLITPSSSLPLRLQSTTWLSAFLSTLFYKPSLCISFIDSLPSLPLLILSLFSFILLLSFVEDKGVEPLTSRMQI